ncbi:hypothetical protein CAOG_02952 [Capsaspora owczarzaki ATCC 30864]|uniref:Nudix hydrolase domain-containing protein n=1 Tax=Capsaspora owczarzaki (strain ATCC 30864) TaxID=595528 RepID=A0A0D2WND1_CAPO3|nr:hypothetical protein CAOG_02952 [Capsaspora owczarzaki ATCC 30864]KJE91888.1 hypothetical protein CAOG_002952 [Capsaspora owczarzaki ATCC 30864]|eukprot:XP_004363791.2 hypothetical protein CAOG_02952 [Capsaspora owczarzaki ATCC 30864]
MGKHGRFFQAAIRETEEEAGVHIRLTGILSVQHSPRHGYDRMRVIFLGEPIDPNEPPKSIPDKESDRAEWVSLADLATRKLRGSEPQTWFSYVTQGRHVAPLDMLGPER